MTKLNKRQISKAQTKKKALLAAQALWTLPGTYQDQGMRKVAKHMNMSTGAIFSIYDSKDDLWRAAFGCEPPVDSVLTRAAPAMFTALQSLLEFRPEVAQQIRGGSLTAWREAEAIIERIKDQQLQEEMRLKAHDEPMPMEMAA